MGKFVLPLRFLVATNAALSNRRTMRKFSNSSMNLLTPCKAVIV